MAGVGSISLPRPPATAGALRGVALTVCLAGAFVAFLDVTIVNVAFPSIVATFHSSANLSALSWVVNGYNVVVAAFLVPAGRMADRLGRRRWFVAGLLTFTLASVACAAASSVGVLIGARLVQAVGAAVLVPTSLALLLPQFAAAHRLSAVSLWGAAGALAAGIGPSLGGMLVDAWSWRAVFLLNVPIGLLAAWGAARLLSEDREAGALPDVAGAITLAVALGLMALGIVKGHEWGWTATATVGCLAGSIALLAVVVRRCVSHPEPIVAPRSVARRSAALGNVGTLLFSVAFYAAILNNVLFLTGVWRWSILTAGLAISPAPLITAVVARPAGRLAERIGVRGVIVPGLVIYVGGTLLLAWGAGQSPRFLTHWLPGAALVGIGIGLAFPNLIGVALAGVHESKLASAAGINAAARQLGGVLGIALLVSILSAQGNTVLAAHRAGWYVVIGFALASGVLVLLLSERATHVTARS
jgi:EmrB/QacA subfamily drug resistance transporter